MKLELFNTASLFEAATNLFQQLGIKLNSNTAEPLPVKDLLKQHYKDNDAFNTIGKTYFIGIIDNTVFQSTGMFDVNYSYIEALQQGDKNYDGLMLFALELSKQPTRTEISDITRTFNRISQKMPVALVLKYKTGNEACFSIAISERFKYKQNWRQGEKAGKVIILRDIHTETTHAGHERILLDLVKPVGVTNYDQLHQHWLQVLDVNILNKKFFQDLANWYFWAMDKVQFPDDLEKKKDVRNATNLIRLITRVVFIWFIKEKSLVPNALFNKAHLDKILKDFNKDNQSHNYYHAILQNLFFGTLNQKMDERKFAKVGDINTNKEEYGVKNLFRYADLFTISEKEAMQLFKDVPFLNGGLFDCLDKPNEENKIIYVDGFSRNPKKQATVPDYIFFGEEREVDLNDVYATKNKKYKSRGLINLLESYKFTVAENTPIEEEIALDPELLGKVFENLLASYNPETQTTARKQTGSFYTPREIVNYMVDESRLEYIKQNVKSESGSFETRLRELISYSETPNPFDEIETKALIEAINNCKILDPACGSGAFPMGILHKMVHLLQKLDPENKHWKALQRQKAMEETEATFNIGDKEERGKRLAEINDVFENNASDYGRKLYLIENCIYGIDIQPIAVQISKLRFFISLIIDQNKQSTKENLGIRSLPNLETKFVAANTLIGLDKPVVSTADMFMTEANEQLLKLKTQLKELRHQYFTANTRKQKLEFQKKDCQYRKQITQLLTKDGWKTNVAQQIASFDPYDQNTFAPWFEPEWMFGLTSGFDIVIGNPPYKILTKNNTDQKELTYFIKRYKSIQGSYSKNLFTLFIENTFGLQSKNSTLSFIIPEGLFKTRSYSTCVDEINKNGFVKIVVTFSNYVFENAVTGNLIFLFSKNKKGKTENFHFDENFNLVEVQDRDSSLTTKIEFETKSLKEVSTVFKGMVVQDRDSVLSENSKGKKNIFLLGKNISKWKINSKYYTNYNDLEIIGGTKKLEKHNQIPRILIRRTGDTLCCSYLNEKALTESTLYSCWSINANITTKVILGFLNSRLLDYYNKELFITNQQGFPQILMTDLELMPIKIPSKEFQKVFSNAIDFVMFQKSMDLDSSLFERLIDAMVYELYLPEEIKAGDAEVLKHLGNLPELKEGQDEQNLKTIEKVYKELSDPKHPISAALLKLLTIEEVNIIEGRK